MAELDKHTDWEGHSGKEVQEYIKRSFEGKIGVLYYDAANNRYIAFADEENRDKYIQDPTLSDLILGTFNAPFKYSAVLTLLSPSYNAVPIGTEGNFIEFTFDTKNESGQSVGEDVICTYTIIRGSTRTVVTEKYRSGTKVSFSIDKYLEEGENNITVGIVGQNTLAATTIGVTYQVVNLTLEADIDISQVFNLDNNEDNILNVPFKVSGYGTKIVEWYIDGVLLEHNPNVDEVTTTSTERTKSIELKTLSLGRGTHALEIRAYSTIGSSGEKFYTKTIHRDIIIERSNENKKDVIFALAYDKANLDDVGVSVTQYITYNLRLAAYNPLQLSSINVHIFIDDKEQSVLSVSNGEESIYGILSTTTGVKTVKLVYDNTEYSFTLNVEPTTMNIGEITNALKMDFSTIGKSNTSYDKAYWSGYGYEAILSGFDWTKTSGWINNTLLMSSGAKIDFNIAPLGEDEPTNTGKTIELYLSSQNVSDDNEIICDLRNENGVGILLTASEATITSRAGQVLSAKYKSEETIRIAFVINRATGTENKGLVFIYINGILSGATNFAATDSFYSEKTLSFTATDKSEIVLRQIRIYNNALSSDDILNNYILYQQDVVSMLNIYNRNNIYNEGAYSFDIDRLQAQLPVMLVTGDIPTLENTNDKDTEIYVDIDYTNLQDPTRSFKLKHALMKPQGTSSMGYPKKNFRFYTQKNNATVLFDSNGNIVEDRLYSFKEGAQPVKCWCLKADYAESSGTHNTGIARLWNDILFNATLDSVIERQDGEEPLIYSGFAFRTEAQNIAVENKYPYDVRTTIDGFPILMFYRKTEQDAPIFIGKYNFNNDKSTEAVFGFTDIEGFDNSRMQCWELLNNGDALGLYTDVSDIETRWDEAFESRYPDTKTPNTTDLFAFARWVNSTKDDLEKFRKEKTLHLHLPLMAAYYVYLMRFGAVDQVVKNSMLTSEDGEHFYFINYDNDTINGLKNTGALVFGIDIDRQTIESTTSDGTKQYVYAGHDSVLWNNLEADNEFMALVKDVDNALSKAGLNYRSVIEMFNEKQSGKWAERIYNQDAQYKYISPYAFDSVNNLMMLQGSRETHRKWWLSRRFNIWDAKFISGNFVASAFQFKLSAAPAGRKFSITAGVDMEYGYGVNRLPKTAYIDEDGISHLTVPLSIGQKHTFTTDQVLNVGDPVYIYSAVNIEEINLSELTQYIENFDASGVANDIMGTKLKRLIIGSTTTENNNTQFKDLSGLGNATRLEYLDIQNCKNITIADLSNQNYFKTLKAYGSGLTSVMFANGAPVETLELPASMQSLELNQLPKINTLSLEESSQVLSITIHDCPNITKNYGFFVGWLANKNYDDKYCTLDLDNVKWNNISMEDFVRIMDLKANGGKLVLKGVVVLSDINQEVADKIIEVFGENVFKEENELWIQAPNSIFLTGPNSILEGDSGKFTAVVFAMEEGTTVYAITSGMQDGITLNTETGEIQTTEKGTGATLTIEARFIGVSGSISRKSVNCNIVRRIYPSSSRISIEGSSTIKDDIEEYSFTTTQSDVNTNMRYNWSILGDIAEYVQVIGASNKSTCLIGFKEGAVAPPLEVSGSVQLQILRYTVDTVYSTVSMAITCLNDDILMTSSTNPEVMAVMYENGFAANESYMTKLEAVFVTEAQLQSGTSYSTSVFYNKNIKHFDEFEYFTGLTYIPTYLFYYQGSLTSIKLPPVTKIENYAFEGCYNLRKLVIPPSVTTCGDIGSLSSTFGADVYISSPLSVSYTMFSSTKIRIHVPSWDILYQCKLGEGFSPQGNYIYINDELVETFILPETMNEIPHIFYGNYGLKTVILGKQVPTKKFEFSNCQNLSSIDMENITEVAYACFRRCISLPKIINLLNATSLGYESFGGCSSIEEVYLPKITKFNDSNAFTDCSALKKISMSGYISSVYSLSSMFYKCYNLESINIIDSGGKFDSRENCNAIIKTSTNEMVIGCKNTFIPESVTSLGYECFRYRSAPKNLVINDNITSVGNNCFYNAKNIQRLDIKSTQITILPYNVCEWAESLEEVYLPSTLLEVGNSAFGGCANLKKITVRSKVSPTWSSSCFGTSGSNLTGYNTRNTGENLFIVPAGSEESYESALPSVLLDKNKCGFTMKTSIDVKTVISLNITADDVVGNVTRTNIYYTAIVNGIDVTTNENVENVEVFGTIVSDEFPQNTSTTESVERTISYTFHDVTATTTIIHGTWIEKGFNVDLNDGQWELSTTISNPDSTIYDGVYQSVKSKGVNNGCDTMFIDISGYSTFSLYIRSYAESSFDYVMVSQLDQTITSSSTDVKAHTRGNQQSGTNLSNYTLVEFTDIDYHEHRITVLYRKDSGGNSGTDRGYVLIPKNQ